MKVRTFLNKLAFSSSTINLVYLYDTAGHRITLSASTLKENRYREELNSTIETFQIRNNILVIYCK